MSKVTRIRGFKELSKYVNNVDLRNDYIQLLNPKDIKAVVDAGNMYVGDFYSVFFKKSDNCVMKYGRNIYEYEDRSLLFIAPDQAVELSPNYSAEGWMLCFHPDLIRKTDLWNKMQDYTFFSYSVTEALQMTEDEESIINGVVEQIRNELVDKVDVFSSELILNYLELLFNYSKRFYGRQFFMRQSSNKNVITRFESLLEEYISIEVIEESGLITVKEIAEILGYSTNYLSDLLKKETGKSTQEHVHSRMVELAKRLLLNTEETITEISFSLGFEYAANFTKFFKSKTGMAPSQFRKSV